MPNKGKPFVNTMRVNAPDTVEWNDAESFLTQTNKPSSAPEVFLMLMNPVYGAGAMLDAPGRVKWFEKLKELSRRESISDRDIMDEVKAVIKSNGVAQAPPLIPLATWLKGVHKALRDLKSGVVEFEINEKDLIFKLVEHQGPHN